MTDVLAVRSDHSSPTLGAAWIRANLLGALVNIAIQFGVSALGRHALNAATSMPDAIGKLTVYSVP
jgi:hypothetical protein